jgi:hypothetical protein
MILMVSGTTTKVKRSLVLNGALVFLDTTTAQNRRHGRVQHHMDDGADTDCARFFLNPLQVKNHVFANRGTVHVSIEHPHFDCVSMFEAT